MSNIKWFHHFLNELLETKEVSYKEFANSIKVDYNRFLGVIHGSNVDEELINTIAASEYFTEEETEKIKTIYRRDYLDQVSRKHLDYIERILGSLYETLLDQRTIQNSIQKKQSGIRASQVESVSHVATTELFKSYNQAIRKAILEKRVVDFEIYMHLPTVERLLHDVYNYLNALNNCIDPSINLKVTIAIDYDNNASEARLDSLLCFSKFIKFFTLSEFIKITYIVKEAAKSKYFIAMENSRVEIGDQAQHATIVTGNQDEFLSKYIHDNIPLAKRYSSKEYLDHILTRKVLNQKTYILSSTINSMSVSSEIFDEYIVQETPIKGTFEKYQKRIQHQENLLEDCQASHYITKSGLINLLDTSIVDEFYEIMGPLNQEQMLDVLYHTLTQMHGQYDLRLINFDLEDQLHFLNTLKYFTMIVEDDEVIIKRRLCNYTSKNDDRINIDGQTLSYAIIIKDPEIVKATKLFFRHVLSRISLSKENTFDYIVELMNEYFGKKADENIEEIMIKVNEMIG